MGEKVWGEKMGVWGEKGVRVRGCGGERVWVTCACVVIQKCALYP